MNALKFAAAVVAVAGLVGCGGGPRTYRVAVNQSSLDTLPASCYLQGAAPTDPVTSTNGDTRFEWALWDGTDKQYLDVGSIAVALGNAYPVGTNGQANQNGLSLSGVIEGGPTVFTQEKKKVLTSANESDTRTMTITFEAAPGPTGKGTLYVKSTYTCAGTCNARTNCEATLPFIARRIDGDNTTIYTGR